ncbi:MAG: oligosaccharide flippase family protein [Anaerolineaceae bacterium]|nr:oligosaccharide flippase family protein [Anaerolineaceae bacterium]
MNVLERLKQLWKDDSKLRRIFLNSSYLFSANGINLVLSIVQSSLAAHLLGAAGLGLLGIITSFASTINRLFSFRMSELVVKYMGDYLEEDAREEAAALVKAAGLVEFLCGIGAFVLLWLLSPFAASFFAKDSSTQPLFVYYGLILLANVFTETATGVLQVLGKFKGQAIVNVAQGAITALMILAASVFKLGLPMVLSAYFVGKVILSVGPVVLAWAHLNETFGKGWWKARLSVLPRWRELVHFGLGSNFSATVNLIVRDSELLWVSYFLSPTEAGYYKVAVAINNLILMPITPFISTTFPELSRMIKNREWSGLRKLLRRVTSISTIWTMGVSIGLVIFGHWVIVVYGGAEFLPAYPAMLLLLVGHGFANIFFWNRSLLLSFGESFFAFKSVLISGIFKVVPAFWLVPKYGYLAEAGLFSLYFLLSITVNLIRGQKSIRSEETKDLLLETSEVNP